MTDPVTADHIYLLPLTVESIVQVLEEKADRCRTSYYGRLKLPLTLQSKQVNKAFGINTIFIRDWCGFGCD
ncbi:MAG: hypothetical protein R2769_02965 [Saprospiraceae bacterium]